MASDVVSRFPYEKEKREYAFTSILNKKKKITCFTKVG